MKNLNKNLWIIALIAMVNMLGYGIIIPILYAYSKKFGLSDFQNGLLFAIFSVCQFLKRHELDVETSQYLLIFSWSKLPYLLSCI